MATTSYSDWVNYASTSCSLRIKWEVTDSATSCTVKATLQRWDKYAVTTGGSYSIAMTSCTTSTGNSFPNSSSNNSTRDGKSLSHTYTKTHSAQTVTVTISTNEWFDTISDSGWTKIGSVSFSKTLTVSKKTSYTVKYAANGGSSTPSNQTKWHGESLTLRGSISRSSEAATAYTVTLNGNGAANSSLSASRTTSYAFSKWKATSGTTYSASGSYTANAATTMTAQWTSSTSTSAVSLPTKTLTGYTFKRWNTKSDDTGTGYSNGTNNYTPTGNVTLYAIWNRTVTFNANNGSGAPSAQTAVKSSAITLSSTIPTRSGYRFTGWNTAQDGSGTAYAAGSTYAKDMPTVTLYAQWQVVLNITNLTVARGNYASSTFTVDPMGTHVKVSYSWNDGGNGASTPIAFSIKADGTEIDSVSGVSTVSGTATRYIQHSGVASETVSVTATNADGSMTESVTLPSGYTSPMLYAVATNRVAETSHGSGVYVLDDAGEVLEITARWAVCESANQRVTMTATAKDSDGNDALSTTYLIGTASSGAAGTFGGTSKFYISSVAFEADKQYTVTVNLKDALGGDGVSKGNVLSSAFFPMDILGDAYYYEPTEDASCDPTKTYYVMGDAGWYVKFEGSAFETGVTYYEKTGPKPGHGVSFGAPCKDEGFHVHMPADFNDRVDVLDSVVLHHPVIERGVVPSSSIYGGDGTLRLADKNGKQIGYFQPMQLTDGTEGIQFGVSNSDNTDWNTVQLAFDANDDPTVSVSDADKWRNALGITDSGWQKLTLGSAAKAYDSDVAPVYRKCFNVVNLVGAVSPKSQVAAGGEFDVGVLPNGYRPKVAASTVCQGSGNSVYLLRIGTNGNIRVERYRNGASANAAISTTTWLPFNVTFICA